MRIHVAIATVGRAEELRLLIDRLADQTRTPDSVVVVATCAGDVAGLHEARLSPHILLADKGLCRQRNRALDHLAGRADIVVFFDDDFVPAHDYLEQLERVMAADPAIVGVTGELVADGIRGRQISFEEAARRLDHRKESPPATWRRRSALYGCNMGFSLAAAQGLRFDTALPLYGWQEDIDFTHQLSRRGHLISGPLVTGIHLGARNGRAPGLRLGYSQVANLVYLWRKGTMQPGLGQRLLFQNLAKNVARSIWPEKHIDRRGRLAGNVLALTDLVRGRLDPMRIEQL